MQLKSNNSMHVCDLNGSRLLIELEYIGRYNKIGRLLVMSTEVDIGQYR